MSADAVHPTEEELLAFADSVFSNVGEELREPSVLAHAISDNWELWVMLYRISLGHELAERSTA